MLGLCTVNRLPTGLGSPTIQKSSPTERSDGIATSDNMAFERATKDRERHPQESIVTSELQTTTNNLETRDDEFIEILSERKAKNVSDCLNEDRDSAYRPR